MGNQLIDEAGSFPRDHNRPPLAERLAEKAAPLRMRLDELAGVAATAVIVDDASAAKVVDLIGLCRAHLTTVTSARDAELNPYRDAIREIDGAYKPLMAGLEALIGGDARSGLRGMLTVHEQRRTEAAAAERQRLAAEQALRQAEADAARRAAEDKKAAGSVSVADELAAMQAEDQAARLAQRAEAIRPAPIRAALGNVGTTRQIVCEITDLRKACGWLIKSPIRPTLLKVVHEIMARHLRNLGVDAVARGVDIPGVEARIDNVARVR